MADNNKLIGILALQGDFSMHDNALKSIGAKTLLVNKEEHLENIKGLVIPGGESTTFLKLADKSFKNKIALVIANGLSTFATCAGLILLATKVSNPEQESLGLIDVDVVRNAYGRQVDSFIEDELKWTDEASSVFKVMENGSRVDFSDLSKWGQEGVFIRAPKIERVGKSVQVLIKHNNDPVFVKDKNIFGATFHPELSYGQSVIHQVFVAHCK